MDGALIANYYFFRWSDQVAGNGDYGTAVLAPISASNETQVQIKRADAINCLVLYGVLPEGLLPRFIARTYPLSEGQDGAPDLPRWVGGVMLADGDAKALVRVDAEERQITVTVIGGAQARLELLGVIQADFETIHGDIKRLNPRMEMQVERGDWIPLETLNADERKAKPLRDYKPQRQGWAEVRKALHGLLAECKKAGAKSARR